MAASRLVPPGLCPCPVSRVRFLFGGTGGAQTVTLRLWDDGAGTTEPGAELFSGEFALTALDDGLQEIDLSGEDLVIDGPVRVGLEFSQGGLPSIARDEDGITVQHNFIEVAGLGWVESASQGVTGDWILRLVLVPEPPPVALRWAALGALALVRRWRGKPPS
jgi:hypothetical protein